MKKEGRVFFSSNKEKNLSLGGMRKKKSNP